MSINLRQPSGLTQKVQGSEWVQGRGVFFYLQLGLFYLRLVFVTYGQLAWSFLLLIANGGKSVWLFYLQFPLSSKLGLVFFTYGFWSFLLTAPHHN